MSSGSPRRIVWFDAPEANDVDLTGGKCRNLAALTAANLPVPPGFVVSTHAYPEAALPNTAGSPEAAEAAARQIAELLSRQSVPSALTGEIAHAYQMLCEKLGHGGEVAGAVRSTAAAQALAGA